MHDTFRGDARPRRELGVCISAPCAKPSYAEKNGRHWVAGCGGGEFLDPMLIYLD